MVITLKKKSIHRVFTTVDKWPVAFYMQSGSDQQRPQLLQTINFTGQIQILVFYSDGFSKKRIVYAVYSAYSNYI